jgi:Asp-tRNA(Asn)/Glu-tRNA(Gln) amidotransferase A subunit family amidase
MQHDVHFFKSLYNRIPLNRAQVSTIDFPSSVGFPALWTKKSKVDAVIATLLKEAHGVQFGKTNVPEMASGIQGFNYGAGMTLNPWGPDIMTAGSSAGSASAVASYVATIAITEDTGGSTNMPATQQHLFGYDPPKFHYPNAGNPSLTIRNDQLGVNARSMDDIIAFDQAILGTDAAHAKAAAYVAGLSNSDIKIGCSNVYYNYALMSPSKAAVYNQAQSVLQAAGFTFVGTCATENPTVLVPSNYSNTAYFDEVQNHLTNSLKVNMSVFEVLLNGVYTFGSYNPVGGRFGYPPNAAFPTGTTGCVNTGWNLNQTVLDEYLNRVPSARSDVYNKYYDTNDVDLVMGPTSYCDFIKWSVSK